MNEKMKSDITAVMQAFTNAEMGNKITQFNMAGLAQMILGVIDGRVVVQQQGQPGVEQDFPTAQIDGIGEDTPDLPDEIEMPESVPTPDELEAEAEK